MFCNKNCSLTQMVWGAAGIMVTLVGAVTVMGLVLSKCHCLKGKAKRLARECECAMEDAAECIGDVVEDCKSCAIPYDAEVPAPSEK